MADVCWLSFFFYEEIFVLVTPLALT